MDRSAGQLEQKQTVEVTQQALSQVSDPLAKLCAEDPAVKARVGAACETAATTVSDGPQVAAAALNGKDGAPGAAGPPGATGSPGAVGASGPPGRGITTTSIIGSHLLLTYSDGTVQDVGVVVGKDGSTGPDGATGATGQAGADGADGAPGATGAPGAPGGLPGTYTTFFPDGTSQTCSRSGGDDSAPSYTCGDRA